MSVNTWVNIYIQLASHHLRPVGVKAKEFEYPAYSGVEFARIMQLLDLSLLDIASRQFSNSVLAATALYLASERSRPYFTIITGVYKCDCSYKINSTWDIRGLIYSRHSFLICYCASMHYYHVMFYATGLEMSDIQVCLNWMHPCATVFNQKAQPRQKIFSGVSMHVACVLWFLNAFSYHWCTSV